MVQKYFLVPNYIKVLALLPKAEIYFDLVALTLFVALRLQPGQINEYSGTENMFINNNLTKQQWWYHGVYKKYFDVFIKILLLWRGPLIGAKFFQSVNIAFAPRKSEKKNIFASANKIKFIEKALL